LCEHLEDRCLLATFVVTNTADDGGGSLRQAILSANAHPNIGAPDAIRFSIEGDGPHTIHVGSVTGLPLPTIADPVSIDGTTDDSTEPGLIELDGIAAGEAANGLTIVSGGSTVRGLAINRFAGHGIRLETGGGNRIVGNYIGTDLAGSMALGNGGAGISIFFSSDNIIGGSSRQDRNLISGNASNGVAIISSWPSIDSIQSFGPPPIGPPYSGTFSPHSPLAAFNGENPNGTWTLNALDVFPSSDDGHVRAFSIIVSTDTGQSATFSYTGPPVAVPPPGSDNVDVPLVITGLTGAITDINFRIDGTQCSADEGSTTVGLDHTWVGDLVLTLHSPEGTHVTLIDQAGGSGNNFCHTLLDDLGGVPPAEHNQILGNLIGTDIKGAARIGNGGSGVLIVDSPRCIVGAPGAGNLISANASAGVLIQADECVVAANRIGTTTQGDAPLGNLLGVIARGHGNRIGTNGDGVQDIAERNLISGNHSDGVRILGFDGQPPDGGGGGGGPAPIMGDAALALESAGDPAAAGDNVVAGNFIGVDVTGRLPLGNGGQGIVVRDSTVFERQVREIREIIVLDDGSREEVVTQVSVLVQLFVPGHNRIGTNGDGVADAVERNVISANGTPGPDDEPPPPAPIVAVVERPPTAAGVRITGEENIVAGNYIGTDVTGTVALGNGFGVIVTGAHNRIGTNGDGRADALERNIISGNQSDGVKILGELFSQAPVMAAAASAQVTANHFSDDESLTTRENIVAGNFIGLDVTGRLRLGNGGIGVMIQNGAANQIGANGDGLADASERNLISANGQDGVKIRGIANVVAGNFIGTDVTGTQARGNGAVGVTVEGAENLVGTDGDGLADASERNIISANGSDGVQLLGNPFLFSGGPLPVGAAAVAEPLPTDANVVAGNIIGADLTGLRRFGNGGFGVAIASEFARGDRIGTDGNGQADLAERNLIAANAGGGVFINGADENVIAGNFIGTDISGRRGLGNTGPGVLIRGGFLTTRFRIEEVVVVERREREVCDDTGCHIEEYEVQVVRQKFIPIDAAAGHGNQIGPSAAGPAAMAQRNVISANAGEGIRIEGTEFFEPETFPGVSAFEDGPPPGEISLAMETLVSGNLIGTDVTGAAALGNSRAGVLMLGSSGNLIGAPGPGNTIAFNGLEGVGVRGNATQNPIQTNSIHSNAGLGIDLGGRLALQEFVENVTRFVFETRVREEVEVLVFPGGIERILLRQIPFTVSVPVIEQRLVEKVTDLGGDGVSFNDPLDADGSPNHLQNFPDIQSIQRGATTRVTGRLHSQPDSTYTIDFYASPTADPTGFGEGARWLGSTQVTTDSQGNAPFDVILAASTTPSASVSATATDTNGNTSEFSFAPQGAVTIQNSNGRLVITGQGGSRGIRVAPGSGPNSFEITDGSRTRAFTGITRGIQVSMPGSGNDAVFFDGAVAPLAVQGNLDVSLGAGNDSVSAAGLTVQGMATFDTGTGNDWALLVDSLFANNLRLLMQQGDDSLDLRHLVAQLATRIDMGSGQDRVWIDAAGPAGPGGTFNGPVDILTGSGDDRVQLGQILSPDSIGPPPLSPLVFLDLVTIDGGAGRDRLDVGFAQLPRRRLLNLEVVVFNDTLPGP
jgi:titin